MGPTPWFRVLVLVLAVLVLGDTIAAVAHRDLISVVTRLAVLLIAVGAQVAVRRRLRGRQQLYVRLCAFEIGFPAGWGPASNDLDPRAGFWHQ